MSSVFCYVRVLASDLHRRVKNMQHSKVITPRGGGVDMEAAIRVSTCVWERESVSACVCMCVCASACL